MLPKYQIEFYLEIGYNLEAIEALSPDDWQPYTFEGDYLKIFYDIELADGTQYLEQYPNAGQFCIDPKGRKYIDVKNIVRFRKSQTKHNG